MIQVQSWLKPKDNSGASYVECIKVLGGFNRKFSYPGDFILVSVKRLRLVRKVRMGQVHLALYIRSRKETRFLDGSSSRALFGWVSRKLRRKKFLRILLLCGRHIL